MTGTLASALTSVKLGATLGGDGTILDSDIILASGSTNAPGMSPGILRVAGNSTLTYSNGAVFEWELIANSMASPGANYDQVQMTGTSRLLVENGAVLSMVFNAGNSVDWSNSLWDSCGCGGGESDLGVKESPASSVRGSGAECVESSKILMRLNILARGTAGGMGQTLTRSATGRCNPRVSATPREDCAGVRTLLSQAARAKAQPTAVWPGA